MTPPPGSFDDSDFSILKVLIERYGLSRLIAALSRICLWQAERADVMQRGREAVNEWRKDASLLTRVLIQLNH